MVKSTHGLLDNSPFTSMFLPCIYIYTHRCHICRRCPFQPCLMTLKGMNQCSSNIPSIFHLPYNIPATSPWFILKSHPSTTIPGTHYLLKKLGVSINGGTPTSSILLGIFPCKPAILGYPHFWKAPFVNKKMAHFGA